MKIEDQFKIGTQRYVCVDQYEHEVHRYVNMFVLKSRCADCGRPFECRATKTAIRRKQVTRRCEDHRSPGVYVCRRKGRSTPAATKGRGRPGLECVPVKPAVAPEAFDAKLEAYKTALGLLDE